MKIRPMSDLHTEFMPPDVCQKLVESIVAGCAADGIDALVLAGDIGSLHDNAASLEPFLTELSTHLALAGTHTVYVAGNHEYFGSKVRTPDGVTVIRAPRGDTSDRLEALAERLLLRRFHALDRVSSAPMIAGQRFIGCTLWYPWNAGVKRYARTWPDQQFTSDPWGDRWPSREGEADAVYLRDEVDANDVVVTHMLPHKKSVAGAWRGSSTNLMFVHPMGKLIERVRPKLWIHGHTHESCDYVHAGTRVVCNPHGYWPHDLNSKFDPRLTIEL